MLLPMLCTTLPGCLLHYSNPKTICFSPDSSGIAYIVEDYWAGPGVDSGTLLRIPHLYWCDTSNLGDRTSIRLGSLGLQYAHHCDWPLDVKFSPDSRYLAVATPEYLTIVTVRSGRARRVNRYGEYVTSFVWLSSGEIGYVTVARHDEGAKGRRRRVVWRQDVSASANERVAVFQGAASDTIVEDRLYHFPVEYWSPQGRYVVFASSYGDERFHLLDLATSSAQPFGEANLHPWGGVSWKADGSAAFCVAVRAGGMRRPQALYIDTSSKEVVDCSASFWRSFGEKVPGFECVWTPDGRYVIANDWARTGGCLVRPRPWEVIPVGKKLAECLQIRLH